ncbi:MBL fold metallo-hydrolase [Bombilactobacillus thymidiniphilus]|uniref:MBL fold metallo-hydrolase n=1 Tax=Bombilactobacillus thymidiniphilus TaxID=2923363 RepID=A0ABY4PFF6_9LACO|nr:MBL fold metallo-hydrolase [Bombilactobacillus thymidiniphilus]UQS84292.1 MBL fold metallo-hydrolase [Bombilactobacillus thymidiniphilus]
MTMNDKMQVSILASSSQGNSLYIKTPRHKILIDAGLSGKKIKNLMALIGEDIAQVDSILVTHEHSDHIRGVGVLARRYGMNVYANAKTWAAMTAKIGVVPDSQKHLLAVNSLLDLDDVTIESFSVSHDAVDPQFYNIHYQNKSFVDLTDTGYVSDRMKYLIQNADGILMECNHDLQMLRNGYYPWSLKQRIISDSGHLSNVDGAQALLDVIGNQTKQVFLGHLSPENNLKDLAHETVSNLLQANDYGVDHDFWLRDTDAEHPTDLTTI